MVIRVVRVPRVDVMEGDEIAPLDTIRRRVIVAALIQCRGSVTKVHRQLGVGRSTVYRILDELGLKTSDFRGIKVIQ